MIDRILKTSHGDVGSATQKALDMKVDKITAGIAGEHFAVAELNARSKTAALTSKNSPNVDFRTCSRDEVIVGSIQAKTATDAKKARWSLTKNLRRS